MYSIERSAGNRWVVVADGERTACVGTMRQCEEWLDFQENNPPTGTPKSRARISGAVNSQVFDPPVRA
jgi:hypothetical protein